MMQQVANFDCKKSSILYGIELGSLLYQRNLKKVRSFYDLEKNFISKATPFKNVKNEVKDLKIDEKIEFKKSKNIIRLI